MRSNRRRTEDRLEAHPPKAFMEEHLRRLKEEPERPWVEIRKELGL